MIDDYSQKYRFLARYGSEDHIDNMIGSSSTIDQEIVHNPHLRKEDADQFVNSPNTTIRSALAKITPHQDHLDNLVNDPSLVVRDSVIENPHATSEHIENRLNENDPPYLRVAKHPNTTKSQLEYVVNNARLGYTRNKAQARLDRGKHK